MTLFKKSLLFSVILLASSTVQAQVAVGVKGGVNGALGDHYDGLEPGKYFEVFTTLPSRSHLHFQAGLQIVTFASRQYIWTSADNIFRGSEPANLQNTVSNSLYTTRANYVQVPVSLKYDIRLGKKLVIYPQVGLFAYYLTGVKDIISGDDRYYAADDHSQFIANGSSYKEKIDQPMFDYGWSERGGFGANFTFGICYHMRLLDILAEGGANDYLGKPGQSRTLTSEAGSFTAAVGVAYKIAIN